MTPNRNTLEIIGLFCFVAFSGAACQQELPVAGINGQHSSAEPGTSGSDSLALFQKAEGGPAQDRAVEDPPVIYGPPPREHHDPYFRVDVSPIDSDNSDNKACKNLLIDWVKNYGFGPWDEGRARGYQPEKVPEGQRPRVYRRTDPNIGNFRKIIVEDCNIETKCHCFSTATGSLDFEGSGLETFQRCFNAQARCADGNPGLKSLGTGFDEFITGGSTRILEKILKSLGKTVIEEIFKEATEDFREELGRKVIDFAEDAGITEAEEDKTTREIKNEIEGDSAL